MFVTCAVFDSASLKRNPNLEKLQLETLYNETRFEPGLQHPASYMQAITPKSTV